MIPFQPACDRPGGNNQSEKPSGTLDGKSTPFSSMEEDGDKKGKGIVLV